jgi:hypothetical protein
MAVRAAGEALTAGAAQRETCLVVDIDPRLGVFFLTHKSL